jgi:hypothetical protein
VTKTIPTDRARQGKWGRHVLLVLLGALALAAVAWLGVELYGESIDPPASDLPVQSQPG